MDIKNSIVGIRSKITRHKFAGTGFFIIGGLILTCAHVLDNVRVLKDTLFFMVEGQSKWYKAEIIFTSASEEQDIAILKPIDLPELPPTLSLVTSRQSDGHDFKSFGYPPEGAGQGLYGDGKIHYWVHDKLERDVLQISSNKVTHGFSGCPVWDEKAGGVIGMVRSGFSFGLDKKFGDTAFAVPSEILQITYPDLDLIDSTQVLPDVLRQYLSNIIARHQQLHLQGINTGNQPLSVSLENVYIPLKVVDKNPVGNDFNNSDDLSGNSNISISIALEKYFRIVIVGGPGCGKSTLLSYIALTYARSMRASYYPGIDANDVIIEERFRLNNEADFLPISLQLRNFVEYLEAEYPGSGIDGPAVVLNFLIAYYQNQRINLPDKFFDNYLECKKAVVLFDGLDEIADDRFRQRVARLIEQFSTHYFGCRIIVTCREVSYKVPYRIGADFGLVKIREFDLNDDVSLFVKNWTRAVEIVLTKGNDLSEILHVADERAEQLITSIRNDNHITELATNPLLLTVIALIHRYRSKLPTRRWELYKEAVEVLLGQWDSAKGIELDNLLFGHILDVNDRRSLLQPVAFWLHENGKDELDRDDLYKLLRQEFIKIAIENESQTTRALKAFVDVITERSGLLIEHGSGSYGFIHLTFQEYLTARVLAERSDSIDFSLRVLSDPWWREVLLLETSYLGEQGVKRVSKLLQALLNANPKTGTEPYYHLLLVAECLFDIGATHVEGDLLGQIRNLLQTQINKPLEKSDQSALLSKITAINALARIESGTVTARFWSNPYGEPDWITIPMGEFWMGSNNGDKDEKPLHRIFLPEYKIARVPVTNAQYVSFVQDTNGTPPEHWHGRKIPPGRENHPVVNVSWNSALEYCKWLSVKIGKHVTLPSEAQWEKAAKGNQDQRDYPWGSDWDELQCNSNSLGWNDTMQVGLFLDGASPYNVLDMSGNVWEWTCTIWDDKFTYPYRIDDGRETLLNDSAHVLRGGSYYNSASRARCASRYWYYAHKSDSFYGFRVVISSILE